MSLSIKFGNFLYKRAFPLYKPLYTVFKNKQDGYEIELLKKHIKSGNRVLDIGANIGFYARLLSKIVGENGEVHCFEPDTVNYDYLKKNIKGLNNIVAVNKAIGSKTESIKIYTSKELNVDHRTYKPEEYDKEVDIVAISVDEYIEQSQNTYVNFIKIDIQGFEMQAIRGMQKTLENNFDLKIISEFWPYGLKQAGSSVTEYFNFLSEKGFYCYLLEKNSLKKLDLEGVKTLEPLGKEHYFNIFASRNLV